MDADDVPRIDVYNKCDLLGPDEMRRLQAQAPDALFLSAKTGEGRDDLLETVAARVSLDVLRATLTFDPREPRARCARLRICTETDASSSTWRRTSRSRSRSRRRGGSLARLSTAVALKTDAVMRRLLVALLVGGILSGCAPKAPPLAPGSAAISRLRVSDTVPAARPRARRRSSSNAWNSLQAGDIGSAERQFNDLLRTRAGLCVVVAGLGYVALAKRDLSQALARFDHAIGLQPSLAPALVGKGLALVELGRDRRCDRQLRGCAEADPVARSSGRIEALRFRAR